MFGEQSALNDLPSPYSIVAASPKVEYYKIHRSNFTSFFGGANGECVAQMRANIILKNNWFCSKLMLLEEMDPNGLWKLEYCSEQDISQYKPTKQVITEVPYS
jgi:hypothetical protein